jgi:hypothetical protein
MHERYSSRYEANQAALEWANDMKHILKPGSIYHYTVDDSGDDYVLAAGHISGSEFMKRFWFKREADGGGFLDKIADKLENVNRTLFDAEDVCKLRRLAESERKDMETPPIDRQVYQRVRAERDELLQWKKRHENGKMCQDVLSKLKECAKAISSMDYER